MHPPAGPGNFRILLRVDPADLKLERRNEHWTGIVDVALRLESSKQKTVQVRTSQIDLPEEALRAALQRGLILEEPVSIDRPADRVRIVLQDRSTGFAGSLWLPVVKN